VKFGDTDCTGRIYFTAYARWADDAIIEFLRARGLTYDSAGGLRFDGRLMPETFVVGEYSCRMDHPSYYDQHLLQRVALVELRPPLVRFRVTIHDPSTRAEYARVELTYVCIRPATGRSATIPKPIAARLQGVAARARKDM
jgi:acyl-CoA thioesterase FadM